MLQRQGKRKHATTTAPTAGGGKKRKHAHPRQLILPGAILRHHVLRNGVLEDHERLRRNRGSG